MAPTGWWKAPWLGSGKPERWTTRQATRPEAAEADAVDEAAVADLKRARAEAQAGEPIPHLHPQAGGDIADDGWSGARRGHGLPATAGLGATPGGLPDHPGSDVLPGFEPRGGDVFDHRAARKTVRPGARTDADDVDQFLQQFADHAAVFARSQHRRSRAGGAGRHQRSHQF